MTNAQEKRVNRIAEHKGFRLEKAGHGGSRPLLHHERG
jgi:hypothetical protein